jgi:hypothetical protein
VLHVSLGYLGSGRLAVAVRRVRRQNFGEFVVDMGLTGEKWEITSGVKSHTQFDTFCSTEREVESATTEMHRVGVKHHVKLEIVLGRDQPKRDIGCVVSRDHNIGHSAEGVNDVESH